MKVLVFGDAIADVYTECTFKKFCPDRPATRAVVRQTDMVYPGGAANVAVNLTALSPGTQVDLIAAVDVPLARAIKQVGRNTVDMSSCVWMDPGHALRKERIVVDGEVTLRIDNATALGNFDRELLALKLGRYLNSQPEPDLILISDYAGGALTDASWDVLSRFRDRIVIDTKLKDLTRFGGETRTLGAKLNRLEWEAVTVADHSPERHFGFMIWTDGGAGAHLTIHEELNQRRGQSVTHNMTVSAHTVPVVDSCGCGDTFLAGLAAGLLRHGDPFMSMRFANAAAAVVVTKERTAVAGLRETLELLGDSDEVG